MVVFCFFSQAKCPKRKVHCQYCEIDCPKDELDAHEDSCGTRTEICDKCQKRVMHRDLSEHVASNCAYPPSQQPPVAATPAAAQASVPSFLSSQIGSSMRERSFRSEELMRMVRGPAQAAVDPAGYPPAMFNHSSLMQSYLQAATPRPNPPRPNNSPPRRVAPVMRPKQPTRTTNRKPSENKTKTVLTKRNDLRAKNTNETAKQGNRKPQSEQRSTHDRESSREELDRLLAMQFSNGLALGSNDLQDTDLNLLDDLATGTRREQPAPMPEPVQSVQHQNAEFPATGTFNADAVSDGDFPRNIFNINNCI